MTAPRSAIAISPSAILLYTESMLHPKERILLISNNLWFFGEGMLGPLFAVFSERIGGNVLDIASAWAAYLGAMGVAMVIVGRLCSGPWKNWKEEVMIIGYAVNAIATFCYLLVSAPWQLLIVQIGIGLGTALADPSWFSLYSRYENERESTYSWGLARGQGHIMTALAMLAGGAIVQWRGFSILFIGMGIVQAAATVYQARILLPVHRQKRS